MNNRIFHAGCGVSVLLACDVLPLGATPILVNGDFSANANQYVVWPGYNGFTATTGGTGTNPASPTGWTATGGSGINGTATPNATGSSALGGAGIGSKSTPFTDNGNSPPAVAFMQAAPTPSSPDTLSQTVGGFTVGQQYVLQFDYKMPARRIANHVYYHGRHTATRLMNATPVSAGNPYYHEIIPFTATSANEQIQISSFATRNTDSTLLLSNFQVTQQHLVPVANANFSADGTPVWPGSHAITGWTGGSGVNPSSGTSSAVANRCLPGRTWQRSNRKRDRSLHGDPVPERPAFPPLDHLPRPAPLPIFRSTPLSPIPRPAPSPNSLPA